MKRLWSGETPVAVFDILGFRELIQTTDPHALRDLLHMTHVGAHRAPAAEDRIGTFIISDTIVYYGMSAGEDSLDAALLLVSASNLLKRFASKGIPLRGAITYGFLHVDPDEGMIGPALVRGYELEQQQEWAGAIVDPVHEDYFLDCVPVIEPMADHVVVPWDAPMKSGPIRTFRCIDWFDEYHTSPESLRRMFRLDVGEVQQSVKRKYLNTVDFIAAQAPATFSYPDARGP